MSTIAWLLVDDSACADPREPLKQLILSGADPSRRVRFEMDGILPERNGDQGKWAKNEFIKFEVLQILNDERKSIQKKKKSAEKKRLKGMD